MSKIFWMEQGAELEFMAGGNESTVGTSQSQRRQIVSCLPS